MNKIQYSMKLYRNLGAITFQSQTPLLQIFTSTNSTTIFQVKALEDHNKVLDQVASFYNHHYHLNNFSTYSEPNKSSALLISNSLKMDFKAIDTYYLCTVILEGTKIIQKLSNTLKQMIGQVNPHQFRVLGDKVIFVWIPLTKVEEQKKREELKVKSIMQLLKQVCNPKEVSQKLLLKKLQKVKTIQDIIEEIGYFSNVYCIGRTKLSQCQPIARNPSKYKTSRGTTKLNLFKLDLPKKQKLQQTCQDFSFTQHRNSSTALHISMPISRKLHNSAHSSSQQRISSTSKAWGRQSGFRERKGSLNRSLMKENNSSKEIKLNESRTKLKEALGTPINAKDEQKLIRKLLKNKKRQTKVNNSPKKTIITQKSQSFLQKRDQKMVIQQVTNTKQNIQKESQEKQYTTIISQEEKTLQKFQIKDIVQNKEETLDLAKSVSNNLKPTVATKQIKKKKIIQNEDLSDEIQVIDFGNNHKEKDLKKEKKIDDFNLTLQNSWNKEKSLITSEQVTKRLHNKPDPSAILIQQCRDINFMGTAVANTTQHLKKYKKIFWQLPLFFIYRGFYLRRQQIGLEAEKIEDKSKQLQEIIDQNKKIKESITKLIKSIKNQLKKNNQKQLSNLKSYLNLDASIDCSQIMKQFMGEYIQSLTEAVQQDQQLTIHLVQISDAFLFEKGEKIDESIKNAAFKNDNLGDYIINQRKLLSKYL